MGTYNYGGKDSISWASTIVFHQMGYIIVVGNITNTGLVNNDPKTPPSTYVVSTLDK